MKDPFADIKSELSNDPFADISGSNSPSIPMSQAKNLPATWSPTVNGQKVNAVYDDDAKAYITSDYGSQQKIVRQRDGSLALADYNPSPMATAKNFAKDKVLPVVNDVSRDINRGIVGLPASLASGVGELYNIGASAVGASKIPEEYMPTNALHRITDTGREPGVANKALEFGVSALTGAGLAKSAASAISRGAQKAAIAIGGAGEESAIAPMTTTAERALKAYADNPRIQVVSGAASGAAGEAAKDQGASMPMQIFSALAAGILTPVAAVNALKLAGRSTVGLSENAMENRIGTKLVNLVNDGKMTPEEAVMALRRGVDVEVEGSRPTSGQVLNANTGNRGLLLGEDAAISPGAREAVIAQLEGNKLARKSAIGLDTIEKGAQQATQIARHDIAGHKAKLLDAELKAKESATKAESDARQEVAESELSLQRTQSQAVNNARSEQELAFRELGQETEKHEAAANFVKNYDEQKAASKEDYSSEFASVDPFNEVKSIKINLPRISSIKEKYYGGVRLAESSDFRTAVKAIEEEAARNKAALDVPELAVVRPEVPALPKFSRGDVNPQVDDMLAAISKYGGLSRDAAVKLGIDPAMMNQRAHHGMVVFPKTGGLGSDEMATRLAQGGYPVGHLGSEDVGLFKSKLHDAMDGEKILTPSGYELQAARDSAIREQEFFDENFRPIINMIENATLSYKQQRSLDSMISEMQRNAKNATDMGALTELKYLVRNMLTDAARRGEIPKEIAEKNKIAIAKFAEHTRRFNEGASKIMHKKGFERLAKIEANIPAALMKSDESVQSFYKSIGVVSDVIDTARNFIASEFRRTILSSDTGKLKSGWRERAAKFINDNRPMLDTVPDLRDRLVGAINKAKSVEDMDAEFSKTFSDMVNSNKKYIAGLVGENRNIVDAFIRKTKSIEKKIIEGGGSYFDNLKDPDQVIRDLMSNNSKIHKMTYVKDLAKRSGDFKTGLRSAFADELKKMDDKSVVAWVDDAVNQEFVKVVFGDEFLKVLKSVSNDAKRDLASTSRKDITALQLASKREGIKSKSALGIKGKEPDQFIGGVGALVASLAGGGITSSIAAYLASRGLLNAARSAVGKYEVMEGRAFTDPKEAARLIEKVSGEKPYYNTTKRMVRNTALGTLYPSSQTSEKER